MNDTMTTELTKAAQQALEALKHGVAQLNGIGIPLEAEPLHTAITTLERALTQRPAAQTEREAFEAWARTNGYDLRRNDVLGHYSSIDTLRAWAGFRAGRASLPAPKQATPVQDAPDEHRSFMQQFDDARANIAAISQAMERSTPQQATPEPLTLGPLAKRNIYDAIRGAYDLGYNDARNARTVPGDSAPGYDGRSVEEDHGGALFNTLNRRLAATPEPVGEPLQGGLDNDALLDAWRSKLPGVTPTDAQMTAFALGVEVGFAHARKLERSDWSRVHEALQAAGVHPGRTDDHLADVIAKALANRPAPGVPEGFALVPVEPTPEMMEAMPSLPAIGAPGDMELKAKGWSLKAIQNRHRWLAALAAAQAKGDAHE